MKLKELDVDLVERIRRLDVLARKNTLTKTMEGNWTTLYKGRGMEFAGYRQYTYGDDASMIDWRASLRSKQILIKEYEEEKNLKVFFLVDVSNSMLFTSHTKLKCEYAIELVATMTLGILRSGDAVGLGMFTDKLVARVAPNIGKAMQYRIIKELMTIENYGGNFDFKKAIMYLLSFLPGQALVIIISDFVGLPKGWRKYLELAANRWEVIGIMVRDPRDSKLPKNTGQFILEDPYGEEKLQINVNQYKKLYEEYVVKEEARVEKAFKGTRSSFLRLSSDKDFHVPLIGFFKRRGTMMIHQ